jgi:hypothetical protein
MTNQLFEAALGITAPWFVQAIDFDVGVWRLTIRIDFPPGSRFAHGQAPGQHPVYETSYMRGHTYLTLAADADARKVVFVTEGRGADTIAGFGEYLRAHNVDPHSIATVSIDMSPAFIKGVTDTLPKARTTFDKFHVIAHASQAVNKMRRPEQSTDPALKGLRWALLKDKKSCSVGRPQTSPPSIPTPPDQLYIQNSHFIRKLCINDAHNLANTLHLHQVVHVQADLESLFQLTGEREMAHRVPASNVASTGLYRNQLRVDIEGSLKRLTNPG